MEEVKFNPGAAKLGNFINYYQFHPPENRISLMPNDFFNLTKIGQEDLIVCLDIGCNSGDLTHALYDYLLKSSRECSYGKSSDLQKNIFIVGIDIDNVLIERAIETNVESNITFLCLDITKKDCVDVLNSYLKQYNKSTFDITFSFSISMWIHLNHGDEGLTNFLRFLSNLSHIIVLEPQPWKCYKNAVRRMKRSSGEEFKNFSQLKIRKSVELDICNFLSDVCKCEKIFESRETNWGRIITIFKNGCYSQKCL